jgi:hypothetical protein
MTKERVHSAALKKVSVTFTQSAISSSSKSFEEFLEEEEQRLL